MSGKSYEREISVSASPQDAYRALTSGFDEWWGPYSGETSEPGDRVSFHFYPGETVWTMRFTRMTPGQLVEMECVQANHMVEGLPESIREEWLGTTLRWEIQPNQEGAKISFVHEGLTPSLDCYEVCEAGWDRFFLDSLQDYLNGKGGDPIVLDAISQS